MNQALLDSDFFHHRDDARDTSSSVVPSGIIDLSQFMPS